MADTPVTLVGWRYNDDNAARPMLVGTFIEAAAANHPDSANFQPAFSIEVEVPLPKAGKRTAREVIPITPVEPRPEPQPIPDEDKPQATNRMTPFQVARERKREGIVLGPVEEA